MSGTEQSQEEVLSPEEILRLQKEGFNEEAQAASQVAETAQAAEAPKPEDQKAEQEAAAKAAAEKEQAEAAAKAQVFTLAGYTEAQIADLLGKASKYDDVQKELSKAFGKFGSIEQTLKQLAESKSAGIQLTEEDVADLKQEYGPDMANAMLKTLNKLGSKLGGAAPKQEEKLVAVDELVAKTKAELEDKFSTTLKTQTEAVKNELGLAMLTREHKDWRTLVQVYDHTGQYLGFNKQFVDWSSKLSATEQDKLFNAWDFEFLSDKIGEYKKFLQDETEKAKAAKQTNKTVPNRVKAAVTPHGVPGNVTQKTALEEQREGYEGR